MNERHPLVEEIKSGPHWRVEIRPEEYQRELVTDLDDCLKAVRMTKVRLRGWDYPHLPSDQGSFSFSGNSVNSWVRFAGHKEYWSFFQSGQFVHLFAVKEASTPNWDRQLRLNHAEMVRDRPEVPGFFDIGNFLWTVTEVFEFAARLCERAVYRDRLQISIAIRRIKGFALTTDPSRAWYAHYAASQVEICNTWHLRAVELVANRHEDALGATAWFFKRFGWLSPNVDSLRDEQAELFPRTR